MGLESYGRAITLAAIAIGAIDWLLGGALSSGAARLACGGDYLAPDKGVIGPGACGFGAHLYMIAFVMIAAMVGGLAWAFGVARRLRGRR